MIVCMQYTIHQAVLFVMIPFLSSILPQIAEGLDWKVRTGTFGELSGDGCE